MEIRTLLSASAFVCGWYGLEVVCFTEIILLAEFMDSSVEYVVHFVLWDQFYLFDCFTCEVVKKLQLYLILKLGA